MSTEPTEESFKRDVREFIELLQGRIGELEAELASKKSLLLEKQDEFTAHGNKHKTIINAYHNELFTSAYGRNMPKSSIPVDRYYQLNNEVSLLKSNIKTLTEHIPILRNFLIACTNYVSDPSIYTAKPLYDFYIEEYHTGSETIYENIHKALGYDEIHGQYSSQGEKWFEPKSGNPLHTLCETIKKEYTHLYGKIIADERREAQRVAKIAANERRAEYERQQELENEIQKIINPIWTWIFEVEERMERPGNTSYIPFSKKVELPPDIKKDISGQINAIKSIIEDIRNETPKTDETKRQLITGVRAIYENIRTNKDLMKTLKDSYPRLYRAFFNNGGRLTKINGKTNLFKYGRSRDFLERLGVTSGGKRTKRTKRTKKQPKQKRRRTVRR